MKHPRSFSLAQTALVALSLPFGLSLVACGGGSSSSGSDNKDSNGIAEYETFEDLYHCSKSHYGELAHVADSDSIYECTSEDWVPVDDERLDELLAKSSSSRKDDAKSSSSIAVSEGDTAKVEQVKVDSAKVTGLAQKGPYVNGTVVTLYELDKDFNHSKKKFTGKTDGEKGEFAISDIVIENQYAELEANGFYMNELTGIATSGTKTKLTALVDLSEAKSVQVNINLFTEFEKALAIMLVKYGLNVPAAKKRATQEILKAFGVNDSDIASATAISLDDTTAAGVALQAASVMVLANQTTGRSNSLIAAIADDFAQNGTWTDVETRALVADKVQNLDSAGLLKTGARDNVLRDYWTSEYGIGKCTSELEEEVKKVENKESANYGAGFACTDSRWHKVNEIDAELGLCTSKFEGLFREAEISKTHMYFVCKSGVWKELTIDEFELKDCDAENNEKLVVTKTSKTSYVCLNGGLAGEWRKASDIEAAAGCYCNASNVGKIAALEGSKYYCENKEWKAMTELELSVGLCRDSTAGKFSKFNSQDYHCNGKNWIEVTALEAELGLCADSISTKWKKSSNGNYYNCAANSWTVVTEYEYNLRKFCTSSNKGEINKSGENGYICEADGWRKFNDLENKFGYCDPTIKDSVIWTGKFFGEMPDPDDTEGQFLVCSGSKWVNSKRVDYLYGVCTESLQGTYKDVNSIINDNPGDTAFSMPTNSSELEAMKNMLHVVYGDQMNYLYAKCNKGNWEPTTYAEVFMSRKNYKCTLGRNRSLSNNYSGKVFKCLNEKWYETMTDTRDSKIYATTTIGEQTWMSENLNYDYSGRHDLLPEVSLCYLNNADSCLKYGRFYTWGAVMDSIGEVSLDNKVGCGYEMECTPNSPHRGICPFGWHVPTKEEFSTLLDNVGGSIFAYTLKTSTFSDAGSDYYSFSVLKADSYSKYGTFYVSKYTSFWTASPTNNLNAYRVTFEKFMNTMDIRNNTKEAGHSLRCIKD